MQEFQSTPPARGATLDDGGGLDDLLVSIHAPRAGGDALCAAAARLAEGFNPRPPRGGRRLDALGDRPRRRVSIHAPRAGGDRFPSPDAPPDHRFQSTPPARGATSAERAKLGGIEFQSTPPARGATLGLAEAGRRRRVSIHAPRAGGDSTCRKRECMRTVSIHAPRAGGDAVLDRCAAALEVSIHAPRAGGDSLQGSFLCRSCCFNPRPPRGGRPPASAPWSTTGLFQSTPPARGATWTPHGLRPADPGFQSTPPARGATRRRHRLDRHAKVSIHAPRAGGDTSPGTPRAGIAVSIHAPRAGGDPRRHHGPEAVQVSIHAPRAGGDFQALAILRLQEEFQSTPPARGATSATRASSRGTSVSIHAPRAGGDSATITHCGTRGYGSVYANPCLPRATLRPAKPHTRSQPVNQGVAELREPPGYSV